MDVWKKFKWSSYWTLDKQPYDEQIRILNEICNAIDLGFKNIIVNANVGIGKSAIATTIANMVGDSYIVTSTTQLQSQYLSDFEDMVSEIKGRRHYYCNLLLNEYYDSDYESLAEWLENGNPITSDKCVIRNIDKKTLDWASKLKLIEKQSNFQLYDGIIENGYEERAMDKIEIRKCYDCPYEHAKQEAMQSNHLVTNYFMLHILCTYLGFPDKTLFVFDEAHNLERNFIELFSFKLNREDIYNEESYDLFQDYLDGYYSYDELKDIDNLITILKDYLYDIIDEKLNELEEKYHIKIDPKKTTEKYEHDEINAVVNEWQNIAHLIDLIDSDLDYIPVIPPKYILDNTQEGFLEFKPGYIGDFIQSILDKADIRLFMSGTIGSINNFCEWNGLNQDEVYVVENKSDFPVENRKIHKSYHKYNLGKFSGKQHYVKDNQGRIVQPKQIKPSILAAITDIINNKHTKGLIHTSSHTDAKLLKKQLNLPYLWVVGDKKHNYNNLTRDELIDEFKKSDKPVILIGPGLKDGIDLPDDYCRFNIILKVPYPGDQYSMTRNRTDFTWYMNQTIMPLMQAYGRGNRHKEDYCETYILDECLEDCLTKYGFLFNEYFLEAIDDDLDVTHKRRRRRAPA